jgi:hypothetical protein
MREFYFLGTWSDSWEVLETLLCDSRFTVSPDRWYTEPRADVFGNLPTSLKALLEEKGHLFIWSSAYTTAGPYLRRQSQGEKAGLYAIRISQGGPGLELTLPACFTRDGKLWLNYGCLTYPRLTEDPRSGEWRKPTPELISGFKEVAERIRSCLVHEGRDWVGKEAQRLLRSGEAALWRQPQRVPNHQRPK